MAAKQINLEGKWLTTSEAAKRLGISTQRIDQLARAGRLTYQPTPLGRLFSDDAVETLRRERAAKSQPNTPRLSSGDAEPEATAAEG